ncbi:unnamed protein product [Choristocarpus tenellus]
MVITGSNANLINTTKRILQQQFEMEDLGQSEWIMGIRVVRDLTKHEIILTQELYVRSLLDRFGMANCNSSLTPADPHELSPHPESLLSPHDTKHYQTLVGSLLCLSICTRPDISRAVMQLTRFSANPSQPHLNAAKGVLSYLRGDTSFALRYSSPPPKSPTPHGYANASYASDPESYRYTSGYIFMLNGGPVTW